MTVITDESLGPIDFTVYGKKYIKIHVLQVACKGSNLAIKYNSPGGCGSSGVMGSGRHVQYFSKYCFLLISGTPGFACRRSSKSMGPKLSSVITVIKLPDWKSYHIKM